MLVPKPTREGMRPMVDEGLITEDELELLVAETERFVASDPVIMLPMLMAVGQKPDGGKSNDG